MDITAQAIRSFIHASGDILSADSALDFAGRMEQIASSCHAMLRHIIPAMLEQMDQKIAENHQRKTDWRLLRKDERELVTVMGEIRFERRYYRHKSSGETAYLLDQLLGIPAHAKVSGDVRQKAIVQAAQFSYGKSAAMSTESSLSRMSVCSYVKELNAFPVLAAQGPRRCVQTLYVEADEDHISLQDGRSAQVKLVYIHEGVIQEGKRRRLIHPRYMTWPLDGDNDLLWETVSQYIAEQYDASVLQQICLSGDCAGWIRRGEEWLYPCVSLLDGYHRMKALRGLCGGNQDLAAEFMRCVRKDDFRQAEVLCRNILDSAAEADMNNKRVQAKYLLNNWQRIRNSFREGIPGCSAEGHVSHILSERLSSRPCGWSRQNAEHIAQLRVMQANGEIIRYEELRKPKTPQQTKAASAPAAEALLRTPGMKRSMQKCMKTSAAAVCKNLPVLSGGHISQLYKALHGLSLDLAVC